MKKFILSLSLMSFISVFAMEESNQDYSEITDDVLKAHFEKNKPEDCDRFDEVVFSCLYGKTPEKAIIRWAVDYKEAERLWWVLGHHDSRDPNEKKLALKAFIIAKNESEFKTAEDLVSYQLDSGTSCRRDWAQGFGYHPILDCVTSVPEEYYNEKKKEFEAKKVEE